MRAEWFALVTVAMALAGCALDPIVRGSLDAGDAMTDGVTTVDRCPLHWATCGGRCVDTQTSVSNCNGCGVACPGVENGRAACTAGSCGVQCNDGFLQCTPGACTACVPPMNGMAVCSAGGCSFTCNPGFVRVGGACVPQCAADQPCVGTCVPGSGCSIVRYLNAPWADPQFTAAGCTYASVPTLATTQSCANATSRWCAAHGWVTGWGPTEWNPTEAGVVCSAGPTTGSLPITTFTGQAATCNDSAPATRDCAIAVDRECAIAMGASTQGYGFVEYGGMMGTGACLDGAYVTGLAIDATNLAGDIGCDVSTPAGGRSTLCLHAVHNWCIAQTYGTSQGTRNYAAGIGPYQPLAAGAYRVYCVRNP